MPSPLFNAFGNAPGMNNNLIQQYKQFRNVFNGDPKQQLQQMLNSGQLSQQRFNELRNTAEQLQRMMR
jgi:hypothetical protein